MNKLNKNYDDYQEIVVKIETKEVDIIIGTNNIVSLIAKY